MKSRSIAALASIALSSVFSLGIHQAMAQSNPQYVLGLAHGVKGVLWLPPNPANSHTGVIAIHRTSNYLAHPSCSNLSQRGFTVLCMDSRFDDNETLVNFELLAQDVGVGVNYLKSIGMNSRNTAWAQWRRPDYDVLSSRRSKWPLVLPGQQQIKPVRQQRC